METDNKIGLHHLAIKPEDMKSFRDIVLESIRESIISGQLKPGVHLKERELARIMGISTTPIKEALRILSHEGLVETLPRKGTYVAEMVESSIEEILMVKAGLEALLAKLAAIKITSSELGGMACQIELMEELSKIRAAQELAKENTKFHLMVRSAAKNPFIFQMVTNVGAYDTAFRKRALKHTVEVEEGFLEHKKIYEAIRDRNPELAEARMKAHIMRTVDNVLRRLKENQ